VTKDFTVVLEELRKPLDMSRVKQRESASIRGGGRSMVPYLEGYDVIDRANELFEFQWSFEITDGPHIEAWERVRTEWDSESRRRVPLKDGQGNFVMERIGIVYVTGKVEIALDNMVYTHGDVGRVSFVGDTPEALDTALSGAATDCLKRCLRQLGAQFGNSLYDKEVIEEVADGARNNQGNQRPAQNNRQQGNSAPRQNGGAASPQRPAQTSKPPANTGQAQPAAQAPAAPAAVAEAPSDERIGAAKALVIPQGQPLVGKSLGEAAAESVFGYSVVDWFAGNRENGAHVLFSPTTDELKTLQEAAKLVISVTPKPAPKQRR
jgi:hypothetical protein